MYAHIGLFRMLFKGLPEGSTQGALSCLVSSITKSYVRCKQRPALLFVFPSAGTFNSEVYKQTNKHSPKEIHNMIHIVIVY